MSDKSIDDSRLKSLCDAQKSRNSALEKRAALMQKRMQNIQSDEALVKYATELGLMVNGWDCDSFVQRSGRPDIAVEDDSKISVALLRKMLQHEIDFLQGEKDG